jgi:formate hydrogenlyase subunit 4
MEFGMVEDALSYEYSGKLLAINKWGSWIKQYLLGSVLLNVFLIPWGLQTGVLGALEDIPIMILKWLVLIVILVFIETSLAKMRLFKIQDYLSIAFLISLFFLIFGLVIG